MWWGFDRVAVVFLHMVIWRASNYSILNVLSLLVTPRVSILPSLGMHAHNSLFWRAKEAM